MGNVPAGNSSLNIFLPERLRAFVQEQVAEGRYSTPSDYVRDLIRADQKRLTKERLDQLGHSDEAGRLIRRKVGRRSDRKRALDRTRRPGSGLSAGG